MHRFIFAVFTISVALGALGSYPEKMARADGARDVADEMAPITQAYQAADFPRALLLAEAARKKYEARYGKDSEEMCGIYIFLGETRRSLGEMAAARANIEQAIKTCSKSVYTPISVESVAIAKMTLSLIEADAKNYTRAEALTLEVIATFEKSTSAVAQARMPSLYSSLAEIRRVRGDLAGARVAMAKAEELSKADIKLDDKSGSALARGHDLMLKRDRLTRMNNDALIAEDEGDLPTALKKMEEAIAYGRANLSNQTSLANTIISFVQMREDAKRFDGNVDLIREALTIEQQNMALVLAGGSEAQKANMLSRVNFGVDLMISLFAFKLKDDRVARTTAFEAALLRKGRSLDAYVGSQALLRQHGSNHDRRDLGELQELRGKLVAASASGDTAAEATLSSRAELLERTLAGRSRSFQADNGGSSLLTAADIERALPPDSALVELVVYEPAGAVTGDAYESRVGAFVLASHSELAYVDLGEVGDLEPLVTEFRRAVSKPDGDFAASGRKLRAALWDPIEALLKGQKLVFLATEGITSSVPFAALPREDGHALVEGIVFDYLTSGRDLLRFTETPPPLRNRPLIIAAPDFDDASSLGHANGEALIPATFTPLLGTENEAAMLTGVLRPERTLTHGQATEKALRDVRGPSILHIATHGFYLAALPSEDGAQTRGANRRLTLDGASSKASTFKLPPNPLLRSGIALAGANAHRAPPDDGILTAAEAAALDLYGTRLVTLSACETGLGDASSHEGVMGLRRALLLAGSQTQLLTLWQVDDSATVSLMEDFYGRVRDGTSRAKALQSAQLSLKTKPATAHPFYWAAFSVSGDYRPFNAIGTSGSVPSLQNSHGCGCSLASIREEDDHAAVATLLFAVVWLWRRNRRRTMESSC